MRHARSRARRRPALAALPAAGTDVYAPAFGEPYSVALDGLGGIEAWVVEEDTDIFIRNVAFVHESYGYFGSFMWIKELDGVARPQMDAALRSLTVPD